MCQPGWLSKCQFSSHLLSKYVCRWLRAQAWGRLTVSFWIPVFVSWEVLESTDFTVSYCIKWEWKGLPDRVMKWVILTRSSITLHKQWSRESFNSFVLAHKIKMDSHHYNALIQVRSVSAHNVMGKFQYPFREQILRGFSICLVWTAKSSFKGHLFCQAVLFDLSV